MADRPAERAPRGAGPQDDRLDAPAQRGGQRPPGLDLEGVPKAILYLLAMLVFFALVVMVVLVLVDVAKFPWLAG